MIIGNGLVETAKMLLSQFFFLGVVDKHRKKWKKISKIIFLDQMAHNKNNYF